MVSRIVTVVLVSVTFVLAGCNTVRGAAADVNSAANCTENAVHGGTC